MAKETKLKKHREFQLKTLLEEKHHWVLDFDRDLKGNNLFDERYDLKGFWVKPMNRNNKKKNILNIMSNTGHETDSDDERALMDYEAINAEFQPELGHKQGAR